jgi:hypothetical protein
MASNSLNAVKLILITSSQVYIPWLADCSLAKLIQELIILDEEAARLLAAGLTANRAQVVITSLTHLAY